MVNRKVWFRYATAIDSGTVIQQKFNPDCLTIRRDRDGQEFQFSPLQIFLTPQEAINDARDEAQLLNYNADKLELECYGLLDASTGGNRTYDEEQAEQKQTSPPRLSAPSTCGNKGHSKESGCAA